MSWFRVDDNLHAHRKARRAGAEAMGLWVMCGSYASSLASDGAGILEPDEVEAVALTLGMKSWKRAAEKLVSVGLWHHENGGYAFHDWDHYREGNSEAALERRREKDAARKKAAYVSRRTRGDSPDFSAEKNAETPRTRLENSPHPPVPSRPVPTKGEGESPASSSRPILDPELGTVFGAALLAAGHRVAVGAFAWKDLGKACESYWPSADGRQRHEFLTEAVTRWIRDNDEETSRGWDHREFIRWANKGNFAAPIPTVPPQPKPSLGPPVEAPADFLADLAAGISVNMFTAKSRAG